MRVQLGLETLTNTPHMSTIRLRDPVGLLSKHMDFATRSDTTPSFRRSPPKYCSLACLCHAYSVRSGSFLLLFAYPARAPLVQGV